MIIGGNVFFLHSQIAVCRWLPTK